jgi:hypothetical protein
VSVTGLTSGQSSTVIVDSSRSGYSNQTAQITGTARTVLTFATSSESIVTTADYRNIERGWGVSIAESGDVAVMGGRLHADLNSSVFVLEKSGSTWVESARLVPSDQSLIDISSYSVAENVSNISSYRVTSNSIFVTTSTVHGFQVGDFVIFSGSDAAILSSTRTVDAVINSTQFRFTAGATNISETPATGTVALRPATVITSSAHGFSVGDRVDFSGAVAPLTSLRTVRSTPTATSFTFSSTSSVTANTAWSGTVTKFSNFGYKHSLAMSDNGNRIAVGDASVAVTGKGTGKVYIYDKVGSNWVETTIDNPTAQNGFGESVAISGDGRTLLITHTQSTKLGAWVYFYDDDGNWVKQSNSSASGATDSTLLPATVTNSTANFGTHSAQLSRDGNTALVAAHGEQFNSASLYGAAYVFTRSGGVWTEEARLVGSDFAAYRALSVAQNFGEWGSSLSPDGSVVAIGARGDSNTRGSVYIFQKDGGSWLEVQKISNPEAVNFQNFGAGVALSESGNDLIVGAHRYAFGATDTVGIAYHYVRDGSSWSLQNTIEPETKVRLTEIAARTGQLSITADGSWLMIGNGGTASTYRPYIMVLEGTP